MSKPEMIVIRATLDEMRTEAGRISCDRFAFYSYAWRIAPDKLLQASVRGALFFYPLTANEGGPSGVPRCILGHDPQRPLDVIVLLATAPEGEPEKWTITQLVRQELYVTLPAVLPWLPEATTYHILGTVRPSDYATYPAPEFPSADPRVSS